MTNIKDRAARLEELLQYAESRGKLVVNAEIEYERAKAAYSDALVMQEEDKQGIKDVIKEIAKSTYAALNQINPNIAKTAKLSVIESGIIKGVAATLVELSSNFGNVRNEYSYETALCVCVRYSANGGRNA